MKKMRRGYTLVEIMLFLAISALLLVGVIAGTGNSISAQRYNDSVQNFAEFLRSIYSQVSNVQGVGSGRSEYAIYGKLVSFGQRKELDGTTDVPSGEQRVFVYDVVGLAGDNDGLASGNIVDVLKTAQAMMVVCKNGSTITKVNTNGSCGSGWTLQPAGIVESYAPRWGASIESTTKGNDFTGTILVVRHPRSGTINTLFSSTVLNINAMVAAKNVSGLINTNGSEIGKPKWLDDGFQANNAINFCINPLGRGVRNDNRRDVRLAANARNASGVEIINMDDGENKCR